MIETSKTVGRTWRGVAMATTLAILGSGPVAKGSDKAPGDQSQSQSQTQKAEGRELFLREWTPGDPRSPHGDGLGPVFNDSSCVACHNAGGSGGGGPSSKNVDIVTAVVTKVAAPANQAVQPQVVAAPPPAYLERAAMSLLGIKPPKASQEGILLAPAPPRGPNIAKLVEAHPGFRTARSVVLHKSSIDPGYEAWRATITGISQATGDLDTTNLRGQALAAAEIARLQAMAQFETNPMRAQVQIGDFELVHSQRNPTALFGIGLIDAIPDAVIEAAAQVRHPDFPEVIGRVSRQKNGRIGRFGWKAQVPSLNDFVLTACAVELGLEVPGHSQGGLPRPSLKMASQSVCKVELAVENPLMAVATSTIAPVALDLTAEQCASLEAYVRALPAPVALNMTDKEVEAGRGLFAKVGCIACHSPKLGEVDGLYSDMLVHDMGPALGDTGSYTPFVPGSNDPDFIDPPISDTVTVAMADGARPRSHARGEKVNGPATRQEWRTPPLWGVRDSSPYLHDGRAPTLERAIAVHGGQGERSAKAYFALTPRERLQVQAFLKSLAAPDEAKGYASR